MLNLGFILLTVALICGVIASATAIKSRNKSLMVSAAQATGAATTGLVLLSVLATR